MKSYEIKNNWVIRKLDVTHRNNFWLFLFVTDSLFKTLGHVVIYLKSCLLQQSLMKKLWLEVENGAVRKINIPDTGVRHQLLQCRPLSDERPQYSGLDFIYFVVVCNRPLKFKDNWWSLSHSGQHEVTCKLATLHASQLWQKPASYRATKVVTARRVPSPMYLPIVPHPDNESQKPYIQTRRQTRLRKRPTHIEGKHRVKITSAILLC